MPATFHRLRAAFWYVNFFRDPVGCLTQMHRRFGPVVALGGVLPRWRRRERLFMAALGPDLNRQVLGDAATFRVTGQALHGPPESALRRIRFGLTRMNGDKHKQQRRLVMPVFTRQAVDGYGADVAAVAGSQLDRWPVGRTVDGWRLARRLALHVASQVLFGGRDPNRASALGGLILDWLRRNFSAGVWMFPFNLPGTAYRGLLRQSERIERALRAMIAERRAAPSDRTDLLEMLVRAHADAEGQMTDKDLIGQANILFAGSFENVASTITWTLFLLAQHPRVMADLHDELHHHLREAPPAGTQLDRLPLLEAVIKESMRILPAVPFMFRSPSGPVDVGGLPLRRGDRVICSQYVTHHLPDLYPEPERFHPERWFTIKPSPYEYLPFGAGPRLWIGYGFSMMALKIVLAMILQRWRVEVVPGSRIDRVVRVTMTPRHGLPLVLHEQDGRFRSSPVCGDIRDMVDLSPARTVLPARRLGA